MSSKQSYDSIASSKNYWSIQLESIESELQSLDEHNLSYTKSKLAKLCDSLKLMHIEVQRKSNTIDEKTKVLIHQNKALLLELKELQANYDSARTKLDVFSATYESAGSAFYQELIFR